MISATYGGLSFSSVDSTRTISDLLGWYSTPTIRVDSEPIPQADGNFEPETVYFGARVITLSGLLAASTPAELLGLMEDITNLPRTGVFEVTDVVGVRHVRATLFGTPEPRIVTDVVGSFSVQFLASDAFKYGTDVVTVTGLPSLSGGLAFPIVFPIDFASAGDPGRLVLTNAGKQPSRPQFTVTGGLAGGFSLVCIETGQEIRFEFPLSVSDVVTVDARSGQAWINDESNVLSGYLTKSEWFAVPAGGVRTVQFNAIGAVTGTPTLTGTVSPAWL